MKFNYAKVFPYTVVALSKDHYVLHTVGYPETPDYNDMLVLIKELKTDSEFDMTYLEYKKDYTLHTIPSNGHLFESLMKCY